MLIIILSWAYTFFITTSFGIVYKRLMLINTSNTSLHKLFGLFLFIITTNCFAIFYRINIEFYSLIFLAAITICIKNYNAFLTELHTLNREFLSLNKKNKILFFIICFITLAKSSTSPFLVDNETYYVQTIKWINEYGFVKGIANLHPFLAQNSSWHALQAATNFSFLTDRINDINGFLFIILCFLMLEGYQKSKHPYIIILIFFPFLMQFINSPSPDLPLFLISPLIFYLFINNFKKANPNNFKIIFSLVLMLCFIKITTAVLPLLLIATLIVQWKALKFHLTRLIPLGSIILILFIIKNNITSGYDLYPLKEINSIDQEWELPEAILTHTKHGTYLSGFGDKEVEHLNHLERFWFWLKLPKLDGIFNKLFILLLTVYPLSFLRKKKKIAYAFIYSIAIIHLVLIWHSSPQYRFFFIFILFFSCELFSLIIKDKRIVLSIIGINILFSSYIIFFDFNITRFTDNALLSSLNTFHFRNIVTPEKNSNINSRFTKEKIFNFEFHNPNNDTFLWTTGNGKLPCINKKQVNYFKYKYNITPTQLGKKTSEGYKSILHSPSNLKN